MSLLRVDSLTQDDAILPELILHGLPMGCSFSGTAPIWLWYCRVHPARTAPAVQSHRQQFQAGTRTCIGPMGLQPPSGHISLLHCGLFHKPMEVWSVPAVPPALSLH